MKVVGLITEYNPFHNGHAYHIEKAREATQADFIIVVMSGNYVQRGTPAIIDKYSRTRMALMNGADIVIELPVVYATASAEAFAYGAVKLLHSLGIVDSLCFGSECADLAIMKDIASLLTKETQQFKQTLNEKMKQGLSYPLARMEALLSSDLLGDYSKESLSEILSSPNNILGIEYLKALLLLNSSITPVTIQRRGACYHDPDLGDFHFLDDKLELPESLLQNIQISSATSIRNQIHTTNIRTFDNNNQYDQVFKRQEGSISDQADILLSSIENSIPVSVYKELCDSFLRSFPIYEDDFSEILSYILLAMDRHQLSSYYDMNLDIAGRLDGYRLNYHNFSSLADELKTKQYTSTRIKRALLHIVLQITNQDYEQYSKHGEHLYARLLGFKKDSSFLLKHARLHSQIPIITKVGDARNILSKEAYYLFEKDIFASHLYNQIVYSKFGTKLDNEYTHGVVRV